MEVIILHHFMSFTLDTRQSTNQSRVITVELPEGKVLDPVKLSVPAFATPQDVDSFIYSLCEPWGANPNPFRRAHAICAELRGLVDTISPEARATWQVSLVCWLTVTSLPRPTANTCRQMDQAREDLMAGAQFVQTALEAISVVSLASEEAFNAGMAARKEAISKAADKATQAARAIMQVLEELRDCGRVSYQEFGDASSPWVIVCTVYLNSC